MTYLRTLAMARIICSTTCPNMQSSWVTMGHKVGQVALRFGANDYGSLMMEENVVSAAGTTYRTTLDEMERMITRRRASPPRRRRQDYSLIEEAAVAAMSRTGHRVRFAPLRRGPPADPRRAADSPYPRASPATPTPMRWPTRSPTPSSAPRPPATSATHFPDTDPRWKGADSIGLLRAGVRRRGASGASGSRRWT